MRRDVFRAIADPTRREILNLLAHQSLNMEAVAENFRVSRTAVYKHIKILAISGLIQINKQGRERYCQVRLEKLSEVSDWLAPYRSIWETQLSFLGDYLNQVQTKNKTYGNNK